MRRTSVTFLAKKRSITTHEQPVYKKQRRNDPLDQEDALFLAPKGEEGSAGIEADQSSDVSMTPNDIRVVAENGFLMAYQGTRYIAQLPDWFDHEAKWTMYSDPNSLESVVIISHPHHPPHKLDRKNMNFKPLR